MIKLKTAFCAVAIVLVLTSIGTIKGRSMEDGKASGKEERKFQEDVIKTKTGDLKITFIGHGT